MCSLLKQVQPCCIFWLAFTSVLFAGGNASGENGTCVLGELSKTVPAYVDWPFRIDCDHLRKAWIEQTGATDLANVTCRLYHNDVKRNEGIFELSSLLENKTFVADLMVYGRRCLTSRISVDLKPFPDETCQISLDDESRMTSKRSKMQGPAMLLCGVSDSTVPDVIPKGANGADFDTVWLSYSCKERQYRHSQMWQNIPGPPGYGDTLDIPTIDFYDAVNFTCSVKYKNKVRYPASVSQCVYQKTQQQMPTLTCVKRHEIIRSGSVKFDCTGQMISGVTKFGDFRMKWTKGDKVMCQNELFEKTNKGVDQRYSCISEDSTKNESIKCVYYNQLSNDKVQGERKEIKLTLKIEDVHKQDFGEHKASFMVRVNGKWQEEEQSIFVVEDYTPYYQMLVKVLSSVLVTIIVLSLVSLLIWRNRIYVLVAYKRSRLRKYDKDNKQFVAYLSYHYDAEIETPGGEKDKEATKKIVFAIQKFMEQHDYKFYDEQREANFGVRVEKITNLVENCHRMILVLTPQYLEDQWRRFHAELGVHGLMESRMGLVFIVTPGVRRLLSQKARNDKVWSKLCVALNTNRVIRWTEAMSEDVLMKHIEYGMPKLEKRKRAPSETDSCIGFDQSPSYVRSISRVTACTEVSENDAQYAAVV